MTEHKRYSHMSIIICFDIHDSTSEPTNSMLEYQRMYQGTVYIYHMLSKSFCATYYHFSSLRYHSSITDGPILRKPAYYSVIYDSPNSLTRVCRRRAVESKGRATVEASYLLFVRGSVPSLSCISASSVAPSSGGCVTLLIPLAPLLSAVLFSIIAYV